MCTPGGGGGGTTSHCIVCTNPCSGSYQQCGLNPSCPSYNICTTNGTRYCTTDACATQCTNPCNNQKYVCQVGGGNPQYCVNGQPSLCPQNPSGGVYNYQSGKCTLQCNAGFKLSGNTCVPDPKSTCTNACGVVRQKSPGEICPAKDTPGNYCVNGTLSVCPASPANGLYNFDTAHKTCTVSCDLGYQKQGNSCIFVPPPPKVFACTTEDGQSPQLASAVVMGRNNSGTAYYIASSGPGSYKAGRTDVVPFAPIFISQGNGIGVTINEPEPPKSTHWEEPVTEEVATLRKLVQDAGFQVQDVEDNRGDPQKIMDALNLAFSTYLPNGKTLIEEVLDQAHSAPAALQALTGLIGDVLQLTKLGAKTDAIDFDQFFNKSVIDSLPTDDPLRDALARFAIPLGANAASASEALRKGIVDPKTGVVDLTKPVPNDELNKASEDNKLAIEWLNRFTEKSPDILAVLFQLQLEEAKLLDMQAYLHDAQLRTEAISRLAGLGIKNPSETEINAEAYRLGQETSEQTVARWKANYTSGVKKFLPSYKNPTAYWDRLAKIRGESAGSTYKDPYNGKEYNESKQIMYNEWQTGRYQDAVIRVWKTPSGSIYVETIGGVVFYQGADGHFVNLALPRSTPFKRDVWFVDPSSRLGGDLDRIVSQHQNEGNFMFGTKDGILGNMIAIPESKNGNFNTSNDAEFSYDKLGGIEFHYRNVGTIGSLWEAVTNMVNQNPVIESLTTRFTKLTGKPYLSLFGMGRPGAQPRYIAGGGDNGDDLISFVSDPMNMDSTFGQFNLLAVGVPHEIAHSIFGRDTHYAKRFYDLAMSSADVDDNGATYASFSAFADADLKKQGHTLLDYYSGFDQSHFNDKGENDRIFTLIGEYHSTIISQLNLRALGYDDEFIKAVSGYPILITDSIIKFFEQEGFNFGALSSPPPQRSASRPKPGFRPQPPSGSNLSKPAPNGSAAGSVYNGYLSSDSMTVRLHLDFPGAATETWNGKVFFYLGDKLSGTACVNDGTNISLDDMKTLTATVTKTGAAFVQSGTIASFVGGRSVDQSFTLPLSALSGSSSHQLQTNDVLRNPKFKVLYAWVSLQRVSSGNTPKNMNLVQQIPIIVTTGK